MKRYLIIKTVKLAALALFLAASQPFFCHLAAEDSIPQTIGPFSGLNNTDSSLVIPSGAAQDLLNVDITPGGKSFKKRKGYATAYTLGISTSPVHGVHNFYDSNGSIVELFGNDRRLTGSVNGGSPSVIISTATFGATWQCVDSQGFAYCANSLRDALYKTNGVTFSNLSVTSTGTMVAVTPERLVTAGFSSSPNRIDFSKANDFTTWTIGAQATDPINFTITSPGPKVTHITYAFNRLMWFKDSSFGYILIGQAPAFSDWQIKTVSPNVGTNDNSSIFWNGILYFKGQDSNIYAFDGSNLSKLTRDLKGITDLTQSPRFNSWSQDTSSDFGGGSFDNLLYVDTQTASGSVQLKYPDTFDSFRDGVHGPKPVWSQFRYQYNPSIGGVTTLNGNLKIVTSGGYSTDVCAVTQEPFVEFAQGTTFHFKIVSLNVLASGLDKFKVGFSSVSPTVAQDVYTNIDAFPSSWWYQFVSTTTGKIWMSNGGNDKGDSVYISSAGINFQPTVDLYIATSTFQLSINGVVVKSGSHTWPNKKLYGYLCFNKTSTGEGGGLLDDFGVSPQTMTYTSTVKNAPSLVSWDAFTASYQNDGGANSFHIRCSTAGTFSVLSSTPTWSLITPGNSPTISTGTFIQIKDVFSITHATQVPRLDSFNVNWFEGIASDKSYAVYHDDALWWAITYGNGATANNRVLRYDLINNIWTVYDIPMNGMYVKNQSLYFGGVSDGKIYKFGDTENDGGSAINAYWKSKDFFGDSPFTDKELNYISVAASGIANSTATVSYTINGSSTSSFDFSLMRRDYTFKRVNKNLPAGKVGGIFSVQVGNNAADQPFEIFGIQLGIRPKPWNTEQ